MPIRLRISPALFATLALLLASGPAIGAAQPATDLPSPASVLGFEPGAPRKLADWPQIVDYFKRLDSASARVAVEQAGVSTLRRPFIVSFISSEENIRNLARIREAQARLADPRLIKSAEERARLIRETPAVVAITCSIHSTEVVAAQMSMELAYRLASDNTPATANILRNTVLVLVPSVNPDGIDIVGNWYRKTLGTKFEGTNPPELYHHYTGHDNNRDWFMLTQVETRIVSRLFWREWFPQVVYDVHQQGQYGSRMFVPPFFDPANPNIDPVLVRQVGVLGMKMAANLTAAGFRGIATNSTYDMWWHGGLRTAPYYHNAVGILSEAASADLATPIEIKREQLRSPARGLQDPLASAINFPAPWEGGTWAPRDILDMELITCRTVLEETALHREETVRNFVELAERAIKRGKAEAPFAYIIPADQHDYPTAARLIEILIEQGVEVHRARSRFTAGGKTHEQGSWVVLMDQPYRANVKALFEAQTYPDRRLYPGGPAEQPYDVAGWTLPMQMGVDYTSAGQSFDAELARIDSIEAVKSSIRTAWLNPSEAGPAHPAPSSRYYLSASVNNSFALLNDLFESQATVVISRLKQAESVGGRNFRPGDFLIEYTAGKNRRANASELNRLQSVMVELANKYFFQEGEVTPDTRKSVTKPAARDANQTRLARPRLALYKSWVAAMDEGWTRWVLEQFGFDYTSITDKEVRAGNLNQRFDVVILPDQGMQQIVEGHRAGSYPDEYTGGITEAGVANLKSFVERGGVLVCLDSSSELALKHFGLPIKNVLEAVRRDQFYAPGSIFRARLDLAHPVAAGMPEEADLYFVSGTRRGQPAEREGGRSESPLLVSAFAFEITDPQRARSIARYVNTDPLRSGWLLGPDFIAGKSALVEADFGKGRVVLFGFRPQHRAQTWGTFKLLFNSILLGGTNREANQSAAR